MKKSLSLALVVACVTAHTVTAAERQGLSELDKQFVKEIAMDSQAEINFGVLAVANGSTPAVREYARWMISTHSFANRELSTIVESRRDRAAGLDKGTNRNEDISDLQGLHGEAFDRSYLERVELAHQSMVAKIENEAKNGHDELVKSFAANFAPAVIEQLAQVKLLTAEMSHGNTHAAEIDANMKAANGGMTYVVHSETPQAAAVREQHMK